MSGRGICRLGKQTTQELYSHCRAAETRKLSKLQELNGLRGDHEACSLTGGHDIEKMHMAPHSDAQDIAVICCAIAVLRQRAKQKGELRNLSPALPQCRDLYLANTLFTLIALRHQHLGSEVSAPTELGSNSPAPNATVT